LGGANPNDPARPDLNGYPQPVWELPIFLLDDLGIPKHCPCITSRPARRLEPKGMVPDSGGW